MLVCVQIMVSVCRVCGQWVKVNTSPCRSTAILEHSLGWRRPCGGLLSGRGTLVAARWSQAGEKAASNRRADSWNAESFPPQTLVLISANCGCL